MRFFFTEIDLIVFSKDHQRAKIHPKDHKPRGGYSRFQVTGMIEWSQKARPKKIPRASSKTQKKSLGQKNYAARALPILFNTSKKSLLKSSYPKKYLPSFRTQKNPGIENFKPKTILRSSSSLEIPIPPLGSKVWHPARNTWIFFRVSLEQNSKNNIVILRRIEKPVSYGHFSFPLPVEGLTWKAELQI